MGWIGCVRCEKFNCKFFHNKIAQSGPPGLLSHSFRYRNQNSKITLNMCFGSNGMDWVRPLRKIQLQVFSYQKCPQRPSRSIFEQIFVPEPKPKNARNMSFGSNGMDWVRLLRKIQQ